MKKLFLALFLISCFTSYSQVKQNYPQYGGKWKRLQTDSAFKLPTTVVGIKDLNAGLDTGQVYYRPADSSILVWTGYQWRSVSAGAIPGLQDVITQDAALTTDNAIIGGSTSDLSFSNFDDFSISADVISGSANRIELFAADSVRFSLGSGIISSDSMHKFTDTVGKNILVRDRISQRWGQLETWPFSGSGSGWSLTGNAGTTAGTNFVGTTDAVDLVIKTNNTETFRSYSDGKGRYFFGNNSNGNMFLGQNGSGANFSGGGGGNTGVGRSVFLNLTIGEESNAFGVAALQDMIDGHGNNAFGNAAGQLTTTGSSNNYFGTDCGQRNLTGSFNNFFGNGSGRYGTASSYNSGFGTNALSINQGDNSSALGAFSLFGHVDGNQNTAVGYQAGYVDAHGSNNTYIGAYSGPVDSSAAYTNLTTIGYNAKGTQSNSIVLGATGGDQPNVGIGVTAPSARLHLVGTFRYVDGNQQNGYILTSDANGNATWQAGSGGSGVTTLAAIGSTPNANGATISGVTLNLEPASASFGGVVTTSTQSFAGTKTFTTAISVPGTGLNSEHIGLFSGSTGDNGTSVGNNAQASNPNTISIGRNSTVAADFSVGVGNSISITGGGSTALLSPFGNASGLKNAGVGYGITLSGTNTAALGADAKDNGFDGVVLLGTRAEATAAGQIILGNENVPLTDSYWGEGVTSTTPGAFAINGTGGSGTNIAGGSLTIAGSKATGNAAGGKVIIQTSTVGSSGTTLQTLANRAEFSNTGAIRFNTYGDGTFTGTTTTIPSFDTDGNIIEMASAETTYTPTLTNTTNIAASTAFTTYYKRVGDWVHVWGEVDIDATAATTISELGLSLPVATAIGNSYELAGTASFEDNTTVQIKGDVTNDRAMFRFTPQTATNNKYSFHFSYKFIAP